MTNKNWFYVNLICIPVNVINILNNVAHKMPMPLHLIVCGFATVSLVWCSIACYVLYPWKKTLSEDSSDEHQA